MADPLPTDVAGLLELLLEAANTGGDAHALLHERVVLHRLDGTSVQGRAEVASAVSTRGSEASLRTLSRHEGGIRVALTIVGVPGQLPFTISGVLADGLLIEIRME